MPVNPVSVWDVLLIRTRMFHRVCLAATNFIFAFPAVGYWPSSPMDFAGLRPLVHASNIVNATIVACRDVIKG